MSVTQGTNHYTVIGQPIAHSLSPLVHRLFGELTMRDVSYTRTEASPETFADTVKELQLSGMRGCNVTSPFKELAATLCDRLSDEARRAGAVNTIDMARNGQLIGHTTDGRGLVADITTRHKRLLADQRILILGAGGAARGIIQALLAQNPASVHIVNRTLNKATELAESFREFGKVTGAGYASLDRLPMADGTRAYHLVINATTTGHQGDRLELPEALINSSTLVYDMAYAAQATSIMQWGAQHGASVSNGLGMLIEQAAESFLIWEGVRPETSAVYTALNKVISQKP